MIDSFLIYLPFVISFIIGYLCFNIIFRKAQKPPFILSLFLSGGLGLGISSSLTFFSFCIFNQLNPLFVILSHGVLFLILFVINLVDRIKKKNTFIDLTSISVTENIGFVILLIATIPLWYLVNFYAHGGWDAWSTWNFKAKFLFLAGDQWQNMFDPLLWRSSPHYPLLLPLINVWGWIFQSEINYHAPVFTTYFFAFSITGLLTASLYYITRSKASIWAGIILLSMLFYSKLALSQYCDNVVGFYLLASFFCLIIAKKTNNKCFFLLAGLFIGFLSFSKTEGLLMALMLLILTPIYYFYKNLKQAKKSLLLYFYLTALVTFIPTLIFEIVYAPENMTFINGLTSLEKPIEWIRIKTLIAFYSLEVGAPIWSFIAIFHPDFTVDGFGCKWNGLWMILLVGFFLTFKQCFNRQNIIFPVFLAGYMVAITTYYIINTHFAIDWWLQVSLNRLLSAILPIVIFWIFSAFWEEKRP